MTEHQQAQTPFRRWILTLPDQIAQVNEYLDEPISCPDPGTEHGRALLQTLGVEITEPGAE